MGSEHSESICMYKHQPILDLTRALLTEDKAHTEE